MLIGMAVAVLSLFGGAESASAHFIVEDSNTGVKALFHVTPDHNPIAGQESVISYDFGETGFETKAYLYQLVVKPTKGEAVTVPLEVSGNVLLAGYTFPTQGYYDITLTAIAKEGGVESKLHYGQRVSRGAKVEESKAFGVLEIGAIAAVTLIAAGAIIFSFVNDTKNRKGEKNEKRNHP